MKAYSSKLPKDYPIAIKPMGEIAGYPVRPGMFDINGVTVLPRGVNFTIHTHYGTRCELLLFHRGKAKPFAVIPFPENYRIGNVYSMIVFGLHIEDFEYAYRLDGPYDVRKGLLFTKNKVLLDIYAKAVSGQRIWGNHMSVRDCYEKGDQTGDRKSSGDGYAVRDQKSDEVYDRQMSGRILYGQDCRYIDQ